MLGLKKDMNLGSLLGHLSDWMMVDYLDLMMENVMVLKSDL